MEENVRRIIIDCQKATITIEQVCGDSFVMSYNKYDIDEIQLTENFISLIVEKNNLNFIDNKK